MKKILNVTLFIFIMSIFILHTPASANSILSKEEALSLIEEAYEMYIDNDDSHESLPQKQSDDYWKSRIPFIFTKEFGDWIYEPYIKKGIFGKYTLHENYKETFRILKNENGEARVAINVMYNIYEEWDYSLIINFKYTLNGWRISGVDHSSVFKEVSNLDNDKISEGTIEALIYNSFTFYRFLYVNSNFFTYGSDILEPVVVTGLDKQEYATDTFVCRKFGLDEYSKWEDIAKSIFYNELALRFLNNKKYLINVNGKAYFTHSGGQQEYFISYNDYEIISNGDGKASVKIDYAEESLIIEFVNEGNTWRISGGSYTEALLKKDANPNTKDGSLITHIVLFITLLVAYIKTKNNEVYF